MRNRNELIAVEKGYRITENGEILNPKNEVLNGSSYNGGYRKFNIKVGSDTIRIKVHRLVAYQKYGEIIFDDDIIVRHLDGDPSNNCYENIKIGTNHDNRMDMNPEDRMKYSKNASNNRRLMNDDQILELQRLYNEGYRQKYLMEKFGLTSKGTYSNYIHKEIKTG